MENIKYINFTDEELSSILETNEEMKESIKSALESPSLPQEIKDYIIKNFKSNPNPNTKEYTKLVLGILNTKYDDFKVTIKIIVYFASEKNIEILMSKKIMKTNYVKTELEKLANNVQFELDNYDNKEKYFKKYIKSMIIFALNFFNENLLPFVLKKIGIDNKFLENLTFQQYEENEIKIKLIKFWKKIYYYLCKTLNKEIEKDLIDEEN